MIQGDSLKAMSAQYFLIHLEQPIIRQEPKWGSELPGEISQHKNSDIGSDYSLNFLTQNDIMNID